MASRKAENFRRNIAILCDGYGNVQKLASQAGITRVYLSKIIHGKAEPSLEIAVALADAAGRTMEELFVRP